MANTLVLSFLGAGVLYYIISAIYFVTLHPLAKFPGPRLTAFTRIPYWYQCLIGEDIYWMKRLHDKYGHVVRFGPADLSYASADGWQGVHGPKVQEKALEFSPQPINGVAPILTTNHETHTRMRRLFSPAFSMRSLKAQEPLFQKYATFFQYKISEVGFEGQKPIDLGRLLNFTTFDIMAELTFGQNLQMLETNEYSPWVAAIVGFLKMLPIVAIINYYPILRVTLFDKLQPRWVAEQRKRHCGFSEDLVNKRLELGSKHPDVWNLVIDDGNGKGLSLQEMHSCSELFMLAGSETTATLLSGAIYYLLQNPEKFEILKNEVRGAVGTHEQITVENLGSLKYMNACLKEALRIYPPVPIGSPRIVQKGGLVILGKYIPPGTRTSVHHWSTYHLEANFADPYTFAPERWLGTDPKYANDAVNAHQPFGYGYRNCIGQNMAMHEMRLLMATMILRFDLELCEESRDWANQKSYALWIKPPLMVRATPRGVPQP